MSKRVEQMQKVHAEALDLFKKKNTVYGDTFAKYGPGGPIVRLGNKINHLTLVTQKGVNLVDNKSIRSTLIDLHNYTAMAIMLLDEKHPRINEIKTDGRIEIPLASRIRRQSFSERRSKFSGSKK